MSTETCKTVLIKVSQEDPDKRIDKLVAEKAGISSSQARRLIDEGNVLLEGRTVMPSQKVRASALISVTLPEKVPPALIPEDIPINIIHKDEFLVVVDKPAGMVVYPSAGHATGTLLNALSFRIGIPDAPGGPLRPGIVHRLDKDTSGVMVTVLKDIAYWRLIEQFRRRAVKKLYTALVYGRMKADKGKFLAGIGRSESDRKKMTTKARRLKEAVTEWSVIERLGPATLLLLRPATGRTHQIRVHLSSAGHPILGDKTYGKVTKLGDIHFPRQMLHAELLGLHHPITGQYMEFKAPLPPDMEEIILRLRTAPNSDY